mmetsp:Transcript_42188/g.83047  ORF Transcript_42188/g.83047 Transcript_42188/m.83047 type:complete len:446 (+) Transcript_42188:69-1406(+)
MASVSPLEVLLGDNLKSQNGEDVSTSTVASSSTVLALYFSASWCPPCRKFTPVLSAAYSGLKASGKEFEVVFVSSDRDEESFNGYFGKMPWLALPFEKRDLKATLSKKYKVKGIPTLVLLDASTGAIISTDGIETITSDPKGAQFPWKPKSVPELLGDTLVGPNGKGVVPAPAGKKLALYFSASWCPPCRAFTPELSKCYEALKASAAGNEDFEFIFVSADKDPKSFQEYHAHMPFPALPFEQRENYQGLMAKFGVQSFPTLLTLDETGKVVNKSARNSVSSDPNGLEFPWPPKVVEELSETAQCNGTDVNETPAVVLFADGADPAVHLRCAAGLEAVAAEQGASDKAAGLEDPSFIFFTANQSAGPVPQIKNLTGKVAGKATVGDSDAPPLLCLLDIPDDGAFYEQLLPAGAADDAEAVATAVKAFMVAYKAGTLTRLQLGGGK